MHPHVYFTLKERTVWETRFGSAQVHLMNYWPASYREPEEKPETGEGRDSGGRASMELEAYWSPATAEGGRQRWKLIGLCGKGGKRREAASFLGCPVQDYVLLETEVTTG